MVGVNLCSKARRFEGGEQLVDIGDENVGGAHELHVEAGVEHVGGGHALVHEACLGADDLGEVGEKRDDVVLDFALDLVDPRDIEFGLAARLPDGLGRFLRDHAEFGHGVGRMGLDLEPDAESASAAPRCGHVGPGVARDQQQAQFAIPGPSCPRQVDAGSNDRAILRLTTLGIRTAGRPAIEARNQAASPRARAAASRMAAMLAR